MKSKPASKKVSLNQATLLSKHLKAQPMTRKTHFPLHKGTTPSLLKPTRPGFSDPDHDGDNDINDPKDLKD